VQALSREMFSANFVDAPGQLDLGGLRGLDFRQPHLAQSQCKNSVPSLPAVAASPTILGFYGPVLFAIVVLAFAFQR
jgi:hypothetical protein